MSQPKLAWNLKKSLPMIIGGVFLIAIIAYVIINSLASGDNNGGPIIPMGQADDNSEVALQTFFEANGDDGDEKPGLSITLSEGKNQPEQVEPRTVATGVPLSDEDIKRVLARLPVLTAEPKDEVVFRLPEGPLPPPLPGETVEEAFPPPDQAGGAQMVDAGPLKVLRYAPEGEVPIVPFINVTFNQPMVPLDTIEGLSNEEVPVQINPELPGTWRWLGSKTLNFQYDSQEIDRLPMATVYTVTIPAGVESAIGGTLEEMVQFSFRTPTPTLEKTYPTSDSQPLEPLLFISFDQRIDPEAVLGTIQVVVKGETLTVERATPEQIEADETVSRLAENAVEDRWLAFQLREPLPSNATVSVNIGPGTPSAEGPLVTEQVQSFSFRTFAPLQIEDQNCERNQDSCPPFSPLNIYFNNPLDITAFKEGMVRIEPALSGASVNIVDSRIQISGMTVGQRTYTVRIDGEIQDVHGQKLGQDKALKFYIGSAEPILIGPNNIFVTLDPFATEPVLSLYTINYNRLDVLIYAVEPTDWPEFQAYLREYDRTDEYREPPGELVLDETQRFEVPDDTLTEVNISLSEVMEGDYGHFIIVAKPPKALFQEDRYWEFVNVWVQITQLGLDAFADHSDLIVWANGLQNGAPLADVNIISPEETIISATDEQGVARFAIPGEGLSYLIGERGQDQALLPYSNYYWGDDGWVPRSLVDELRWYVFDDRRMYRSGEEIHVKGWMRRIGAGPNGDVGMTGDAVSAVQYQIIGPQGNEFESGLVEVNAWGGFDFAVTLPENINLGSAKIMLSAEGTLSNLNNTEYNHRFQIQEFRRPEFEVSARNETTGPYFVKEHAVVAVEAEYYAGGPLPNAAVDWRIQSSPTNYQPPNWPDFSFGYWTPWWWYFEEGSNGQTRFQNFTGKTDASGNHYLRLDFESVEQSRPYSVMAESTVFDVNRQAWTGTTSLMVHPADLYVGLRSERYFVEQGTPLDIDLIVTDLDGKPSVGESIEVETFRLVWKNTPDGWQEQEEDLQTCSIKSGESPVNCSFETPVGGRYQITATVTDAIDRRNQTRITRWVSGGERPPARQVERETVNLIPDQETYQPGDVAEILVEAPFAPAEGLLTISRSGVVSTERFEMDTTSTTLKIAIEKGAIPNLHIKVDLAGAAPRVSDEGDLVEGLPPRPAYASGQLNLSIPPLDRTLVLDVSPRQTMLEPGGETELELHLEDAEGQPVAEAELAVVVVDEAILALTNYQLANPLSVFYQTRPSGVSSTYSRASILLVDPEGLAGQTEENLAQAAAAIGKGLDVEEEMAEVEAPAPQEAMADEIGRGAGATEADLINVRMDFNPLATFAPTVRTDAKGNATVKVILPDNLTRYRIMVVAVDASSQKFGSAESSITARLPLMVRPSAPRFLNFGDQFDLPIVLQNQTDEDMEVNVVVEAANLSFNENVGLRVMIPANDRVEVRFPAAAEMAGTARLQIAGVSGSYSDAASVALPVYTPATTEAFATYGVVDDGAVAQPVAAPEGVFPQFGGLEVNTSSTALHALTDAVIYLVSYPYECSEQIASRILAVAALRDVLSAFEAEELPSTEEMKETVQGDIELLEGLQNNDGGFPIWRRGQDSIPFHTIHVAHALARAESKGFAVPEEMKQWVLEYLRDIEEYYPHWYAQRTRHTLSAYAVYVRNLIGDPDPVKARTLFNEAGIENLTLDAIGWIWPVLINDPGSEAALESIRTYIGNRVVETAGAANFTISVSDQSYVLLRSNRRTDAILLDALIHDDPDSDLISKLVNGLLAHRVKGRWSSTQENIFVLLALDHYFNTFEAQTPDFVARIWLGETYAASHQYEGYTTERHGTEIPMSYLVEEELGGGEPQNLILSKEGQGRLYYRLGLRYAPTDLNLDPLDMGFVVTRSYESIDDPEDAFQDDDGAWHIKAGARVRVRLIIVADNRRYHVALVDPLPAGLEIVNPALAVSQDVPDDPESPDSRYRWWWTWYQHQNMRDERAEAFTTLLWDGVYEYTYVARATTPGTFIVPPAKAEEMYSPEVFGRSASDWVIVE